MSDTKKSNPSTNENENITYIERNGKTFEIVNHFNGTSTYLDIVENALRRELDGEPQTI